MMRKNNQAAIFVTCLAVFCFGTSMLYMEISGYKAARNVYTDLRGSSHSALTLVPETWPPVGFDARSAVNPDIAAWIVSGDGTIDYPIVYSGDNDFYLGHLFDKTPNKAGCLFIDGDNAPDFSDCNTIIYGHNMKDGSMFGGLEQYREQAYYDENPRMKLMTPGGNYTLELFAAYVTDGNGDAWKLDFASGTEYVAWAEKAKSRSAFKSSVTVTETDHVVTLSTCAYDFKDAFFVVMGVLVPSSSHPDE